MSDHESPSGKTPNPGDVTCLDPQIVERVGTMLVQGVMLLLPVVANYFLQKFLKKAIEPLPILKANAGHNLSNHPAPAKEQLRDD